MSKQTPKPNAFQKNTVIYEDDHFAVAYGMDSSGKKRLAMRWKGDGSNDKGFPKVFGNPQWFLLPEYDNWTPEILKAIEQISIHKKKLNEFEAKW
uniref:hypothetical protein n=1 Tax=Roseivirga sp. TaxID=1964215 RepID=UPI004047394C